MSSNPYQIEGEDRPGRWLVTCDHASNHVPDWISGGFLGLPPHDMARHIAYDVGAAGVAAALGEMLDGTTLSSRFSRLVIDPNRGLDDPTLLMRLYDGTIIPANRDADEAELERRLDRLYRPYHDAYARLAARRDDTVICAVHSFTPQFHGRPSRPWDVGVLYAHDDRLALPFLEKCRAQGWCVGNNEPYSGHLDGDAVDRHALQHGRPNVLIELRNDLISTPDTQRDWAAKLAPLLIETLAESGL